jgi:DNA-binding GntR family transcriptional regulator
MLQRFKEASAIDGIDEEESAAVPLAQTAWQRLRDDIICGKLRPKARLRIGKLRETYGIGASPLREALSRLVSDGFVVSLDRRGFMVAPISLREFRELTDMRKLLEKEAARLARKL